MIQPEPPPYFHDSPAHVSTFGSPSAGIVYVFHTTLPSSADKARTQPRTPYSAPAVPWIILPLRAIGMIVEVSAYV